MWRTMNYGEILPGDMFVQRGWRKSDLKSVRTGWLVLSVVKYRIDKKKRPRDKKPRIDSRQVRLTLMRMWTDNNECEVFGIRDYDVTTTISMYDQVIRNGEIIDTINAVFK